ncbi:hypothetical protein D1007_11889 [Hordeum vulgare]|nr:hypothetical protein D1007_11889 [Hordeum vulgare]
MYRLDERANAIAGLPVVDERGLFPAEGSDPVEVSSGDTPGEGDSEKTVDECPASAPLPSQAVLLRELEDDDAASEVSVGVPSRPTRTSTGPTSTQRYAVCVHARHPEVRGWVILGGLRLRWWET